MAVGVEVRSRSSSSNTLPFLVREVAAMPPTAAATATTATTATATATAVVVDTTVLPVPREVAAAVRVEEEHKWVPRAQQDTVRTVERKAVPWGVKAIPILWIHEIKKRVFLIK